MSRIALVLVLAASVAASGCGGDEESEADAAPQGCGSAGAPVTVSELVTVFRENGISLEVNQRKCRTPASTRPDATNAGPSGLARRQEVDRKEGAVLCHVGPKLTTESVEVVKYPTDEETHLTALNIQCSVYPYDAAREREQVARVETALRAMVDQE